MFPIPIKPGKIDVPLFKSSDIVIKELHELPSKKQIAVTIFGWMRQEFNGGETVATIANATVTFVALKNGVPIGTASLVPCDLPCAIEKTPWLAGLYVLPSERRKKVATALMSAVEDFALALEFEKLHVVTKYSDFYSRHGWEREKGVSPDPIVMTKTL